MKAIDFTPQTFDAGDPRFAGTVSGIHHAPPSDDRLHAYLVSFEPGGRTAWHSHLRGQLIVCTAGRGRVVTRDGSELALHSGTAVWTEPGEDHWHGAAEDSAMTHLAVQTADPGGDGAQWNEPVAAAADGTDHG